MYIKLETFTKVTRTFHDGKEWFVDTESGTAYALTDIVPYHFVVENVCYVLHFPNGSYIICDEKEANELLS